MVTLPSRSGSILGLQAPPFRTTLSCRVAAVKQQEAFTAGGFHKQPTRPAPQLLVSAHRWRPFEEGLSREARQALPRLAFPVHSQLMAFAPGGGVGVRTPWVCHGTSGKACIQVSALPSGGCRLCEKASGGPDRRQALRVDPSLVVGGAQVRSAWSVTAA